MTIWAPSIHKIAKRDFHIKTFVHKRQQGSLSRMRDRSLPRPSSTWAEPTWVARTKPRLELDTVSTDMLTYIHTHSREISKINLREKFWIPFYFRKRVDCGVPTRWGKVYRERIHLGCYWKFYMRKLGNVSTFLCTDIHTRSLRHTINTKSKIQPKLLRVHSSFVCAYVGPKCSLQMKHTCFLDTT